MGGGSSRCLELLDRGSYRQSKRGTWSRGEGAQLIEHIKSGWPDHSKGSQPDSEKPDSSIDVIALSQPRKGGITKNPVTFKTPTP